MQRITPKTIESLLADINKLDTDQYCTEVWQYDYWANAGYYLTRLHDNPCYNSFGNRRLSPKETHAFLSGILASLQYQNMKNMRKQVN